MLVLKLKEEEEEEGEEANAAFDGSSSSAAAHKVSLLGSIGGKKIKKALPPPPPPPVTQHQHDMLARTRALRTSIMIMGVIREKHEDPVGKIRELLPIKDVSFQERQKLIRQCRNRHIGMGFYDNILFALLFSYMDSILLEIFLKRVKRSAKWDVLCGNTTVLHVACSGCFATYFIQHLYKLDREAVTVGDLCGKTPFHYACVKHPPSVLYMFLKDYPEAIKHEDKDGCTPLYYLCQEYTPSKFEKLKFLLESWPVACLLADESLRLPDDALAATRTHQHTARSMMVKQSSSAIRALVKTLYAPSSAVPFEVRTLLEATLAATDDGDVAKHLLSSSHARKSFLLNNNIQELVRKGEWQDLIHTCFLGASCVSDEVERLAGLAAYNELSCAWVYLKERASSSSPLFNLPRTCNQEGTSGLGRELDDENMG